MQRHGGRDGEIGRERDTYAQGEASGDKVGGTRGDAGPENGGGEAGRACTPEFPAPRPPPSLGSSRASKLPGEPLPPAGAGTAPPHPPAPVGGAWLGGPAPTCSQLHPEPHVDRSPEGWTGKTWPVPGLTRWLLWDLACALYSRSRILHRTPG